MISGNGENDGTSALSSKSKNVVHFAFFVSMAGNVALVQGMIRILRVPFVKMWKMTKCSEVLRNSLNKRAIAKRKR